MKKDKDRVFQLIGRLTIQFATMEHRLQGLLETLMGDGNSLVGPLLIHNMPLAGLLKKISVLAHCRIGENSQLLLDLERAIKKINDLREERNLLIHGDWKIENSGSSRIIVRDFKMKYEQGAWQEFSETIFSEKKLTDLNRRLEGLGNEVDYIVRRLEEIPAIVKTCN
jgi:hypothetical protein